MKNWFSAAVMLVIVMGCQEATPPAATDAEVPQPGPATRPDPGPAPEGQWEPGDGEPGDSESAPVETIPADETASTRETVSLASPVEVAVSIQSWDETQKLIDSHRGQVVVVDFWSLSCLPCRREFPHFVELHQKHGEQVACISVSLDYTGRASKPPESYSGKVTEFLAKQAATFDNVISSDDPDALEQRLELKPIPLVWVYDKTGQKRKQFENSDPNGDEFTYAGDVVPFVESLLSEN